MDRSKIQLLVDQRGSPLSVQITGANVHDKGLADELIISIGEYYVRPIWNTDAQG